MFTSEERPTKSLNKETKEIVFSGKDGKWVHFLHNDPIVIKAIIENHVIGRILVDNGSSVDILYGETYEKKKLK